MRFMGLWDFATDPVGTILNALRTLLYELSGLIYKLIIWLYDIFMKLCNSRVLDSEVLELMASRVGVVLGLIMLFMTMFSVVQMILEPEKLSDKEKGVGNIVKKILIVIVMLGMSSSAFSLMYGVQKTIIRSNIIAKFLLPYEVNTDNFGGVLSAELFTAFYKFDESLEVDGLDSDEEKCKNSINTLKGEIITYGTFTTGNDCLAEKSGDKYIMDFNWLLLPIVGIGAVYFIFSYCLSVGMRTFQLAFLEIISPMAIVSYLSPKKDTMFQKWWKIYFSTYIDVFLRIAIINVSVFLIAVIFDTNMSGTFWESVDNPTGGWTRTLLTVFIVMSLLMFAKKAPDLLKELFPSSASKLGMGITPPKKLLDNMAGADLIKRGYGAVNVGARAWGKNVRKAAGNLMYGDKNDRAKNAFHLVGALAFGGLAGARRGLMTTDASGRNRAVENAYAARQSKLKMRSLGYGRGAQFKDGWKNFLLQDQYLDDRANMKDLEISTYQAALSELQKNYLNDNTKKHHKVSKMLSEDGKYIFDSGIKGAKVLEGKLVKNQNNDDYSLIDDKGTVLCNRVEHEAVEIANMQSNIGKAQSDVKKMRQRAEEQKQKANGGKK